MCVRFSCSVSGQGFLSAHTPGEDLMKRRVSGVHVCVGLCSDLCRGLWAGEGSQSPDDVESGERAGGEEGAGQDHDVALNHLQAGLPHGHPERTCVHQHVRQVTPGAPASPPPPSCPSLVKSAPGLLLFAVWPCGNSAFISVVNYS